MWVGVIGKVNLVGCEFKIVEVLYRELDRE